MSNTPLTDEIIKYCDCQFPATQGHIPLRQMIEKIELDKNAVQKDFDELASEMEPVMEKATNIFDEYQKLKLEKLKIKELLFEIQDWMMDNDYECGPVGSKLYEDISNILNAK